MAAVDPGSRSESRIHAKAFENPNFKISKFSNFKCSFSPQNLNFSQPLRQRIVTVIQFARLIAQRIISEFRNFNFIELQTLLRRIRAGVRLCNLSVRCDSLSNSRVRLNCRHVYISLFRKLFFGGHPTFGSFGALLCHSSAVLLLVLCGSSLLLLRFAANPTSRSVPALILIREINWQPAAVELSNNSRASAVDARETDCNISKFINFYSI